MGDILLAPRCCGGCEGTAAQKMKVGLVGGEGRRMGGGGDPKRFLFWVGGRRRRNRAPGDGALGFFLFLSF